MQFAMYGSNLVCVNKVSIFVLGGGGIPILWL